MGSTNRRSENVNLFTKPGQAHLFLSPSFSFNLAHHLII